MSKWPSTAEHDNLMMLGHLRPGDLFYMTEYDGHAWYTCIAVVHTEDREGIPTSKGLMLMEKDGRPRLVEFSKRSAKEICVPEGREWPKRWDVVPYGQATW